MKFEIGKEYRTRDGRKAGIYCDLSSTPDYTYEYPVKGYIEFGSIRQDATWTSEGKYFQTDGYDSYKDLVLPVRESQRYIFLSWRNGFESTFIHRTLESANTEREICRKVYDKVSFIFPVVFTEDLGE